MTQSSLNASWQSFSQVLTFAQDVPTAPQAGAAPAVQSAPPPSAVPTKAVGVPGAASTGVAPVGGAVVPQAQPAASPFGGSTMIILMVAMLGVVIIPSILTGRREKKKRAELFAGMKKGDRVQTGSGIIGTITEIGQDDVVLKMEEGRIRFAKAAIVAILKSAVGGGGVGGGAKNDGPVAELKGESKAVRV